jgi:hypothetical protein
MSRLVNRDPFAREELHVERVHDPATTCTWCGGIRMTAHSGINWLYRFWVETDGGRKYVDEQLFCSRNCRNCYFG